MIVYVTESKKKQSHLHDKRSTKPFFPKYLGITAPLLLGHNTNSYWQESDT